MENLLGNFKVVGGVNLIRVAILTIHSHVLAKHKVVKATLVIASGAKANIKLQAVPQKFKTANAFLRNASGIIARVAKIIIVLEQAFVKIQITDTEESSLRASVLNIRSVKNNRRVDRIHGRTIAHVHSLHTFHTLHSIHRHPHRLEFKPRRPTFIVMKVKI